AGQHHDEAIAPDPAGPACAARLRAALPTHARPAWAAHATCAPATRARVACPRGAHPRAYSRGALPRAPRAHKRSTRAAHGSDTGTVEQHEESRSQEVLS